MHAILGFHVVVMDVDEKKEREDKISRASQAEKKRETNVGCSSLISDPHPPSNRGCDFLI